MFIGNVYLCCIDQIHTHVSVDL